MKELLIVRHGKSSWDVEGIADIDRPLKERGILDGYKMAKHLLQRNTKPELLISSPANRAIHTATIFAREMGYPYEKITIHQGIYFAGVEQIFDLISSIRPEINVLMIFGHNPTFTDLANCFISQPIDNIPTTGIVHIQFETNNWSEIKTSKIRNWDFDYPKKQI